MDERTPEELDTDGTGWSIGRVADRLGLDPDTLRYYERRGVVPGPRRDVAGRRWYRTDDLHLIEVLMHLKDTGMPLARIAEFTRLVATDPAGVPERLALLEDHRRHIEQQIDAWHSSLAVIEAKIGDYTRRLH